MKVYCLFTVLLLTTSASWLDPQTPSSFHETHTLTAHQFKAPLVNKTKLNTTKHIKHNHKTSKPTVYHTNAPTITPTPYPTHSPDYIPPVYSLVFSDEFNTPGRTFNDGDDPAWTAIDKNDYTNDALHYYSPEMASTSSDGYLVIKTAAIPTVVSGFDDITLSKEKITKQFRSAMVQSWNKFCFTGGIIETEVILPGKGDVGGLWPAFWLLGNIARHTFVGTSNNIWPWSRTTCDEAYSKSQKISACSEVSHYGMEKGVGRGAPEVDIFEVQPGPTKAGKGDYADMTVGQPLMSASFQVAPGKTVQRPGPGTWPGEWTDLVTGKYIREWYDNHGLLFGPKSTMNINFYGTYNHFKDATSSLYDYWSDAISFNRQLSQSHFETTHTYRLEWEIPSPSYDGHMHWFIDGELILAIDGHVITNVTGAEIPSEPLSIIMNTAVSKQWGFPSTCPSSCKCPTSLYDCNSPHFDDKCGFSPGFCKMLESDTADHGGSEYKINYVRVYQNLDDPAQKVGCSTPERPTKKWIKANEKLYTREGDSEPLKKIARGGGVVTGVMIAEAKTTVIAGSGSASATPIGPDRTVSPGTNLMMLIGILTITCMMSLVAPRGQSGRRPRSCFR